MALKTQENTASRASPSTPGVGTGAVLESWKEIAAYLKRDERTAMRWEKEQGMPVHRVPGKRGRVYAHESELAAWLGRSAQAVHQPPDGQPPEAVRRKATRWPWRHIAAIAGTAILLGLLSAALIRSRSPSIPARVHFSVDSVEALDSDGRLLWTHHYNGILDPRDMEKSNLAELSTMARISDLLGTGEREVLLIAPLRTGPNPQNYPRSELDCFSSRGRLLWSYVPHESFQFGNRVLNGPWISYDVMVSGKPSHAIYLACNHVLWGDSFVAEIDPKTGHGAVRFVNTGTLHCLNELHTYRANYLLVGGFNNEFDGGSLAAIDETRTFAASPQTDGTRHKCVSCPVGVPDYYFVFPRSELNRVSQVYQNPVTSADVEASEVEVRKRELGRNDVETLYLFDTEPALRPISMRYGSLYDVLHAELEKSRKLDHPFARCPERLHPSPVKMWTPGAGWTDLQIASAE